MKKQVKADLMLVLVTLCWGMSYFLMDLSLTDLGPFNLNAFRFLGGFLVSALILFKHVKNVNKETLKYSFYVGLSLVFVYIGATFGVKYTTLSNTGFLCGLTVFFVPIFDYFIFHKKIEKKMIVSVAFCLLGTLLLTLKDDFSINFANLKGDVLCLMCAFFYAIDLVITERAVSREKVDALNLGVYQLGFTGIMMLVLSFIFEKPHIPQEPKIIGSVIFLAVFCTAVAFIIQSVAQKYTTAAHVGVIFTLEPVFSAIVAYFLAHEVLTVKSYIGAFIMVIALVVIEIDFGSYKKNKHKKHIDVEEE